MTDLASLLAAFKAASGYEASVWSRNGHAVVLDAGTDAASPPEKLPSLTDHPVAYDTPHGRALVACIPGPSPSWLRIGPGEDPRRLDILLDFLLPVVAQLNQSSLEVEHAAGELAERYEEINLLYTISEILGRTVDLRNATTNILAEISDVVGARRGAVHVFERETRELVSVATLGESSLPARIAADDPRSALARVFRAATAQLVDSAGAVSQPEDEFRRGAMLVVPILWTTRAEPETLGVVTLTDRRSGVPFSAGDQKLLAAIATQIGTAIQNTRLVRESLRQQRLLHEMELAHDLQMRLLPPPSVVAPDATVGARVVPAESVGGDLYNLFRLGAGRVGIMVGDVSGHGYQAALVMALSMSASAIHAQSARAPGAMLAALQQTLANELTQSEMFVSTFYGVIDAKAGRLQYSNAGHPHAFHISREGRAERLAAINLPIGMSSHEPGTAERPWEGGDTLLVFTDGISDARNHAGQRFGEERVVELALQHRGGEPQAIVDLLIEAVRAHSAGAPSRDDLTIVVARS